MYITFVYIKFVYRMKVAISKNVWQGRSNSVHIVKIKMVLQYLK